METTIKIRIIVDGEPMFNVVPHMAPALLQLIDEWGGEHEVVVERVAAA